jgi:hypothetical protein
MEVTEMKDTYDIKDIIGNSTHWKANEDFSKIISSGVLYPILYGSKIGYHTVDNKGAVIEPWLWIKGEFVQVYEREI